MQILINRSCCKITFEENEKYYGKTLLIEGEGNLEGEFCIYKSLISKMCWKDSLNAAQNRFVYVDEELQTQVLAYVLEESKKHGVSLVLW